MADAQGKFVAAEPLFDDLPRGWARVPLGVVVEVNPSGKTVSPTDETQVTFLPMAAVEELSGRIDTSTTRPFGDVKKGFTRFRDGDLLFAKITPSMENGKIAVARNLRNGMGCGTTEFHVLRPSECIEADYLRYFVVRDCFRGEAQRQMSGAVGQQRVPAQFLSQYSLPLPPLAEQRRIVSRIDELFSRIEAGERAIEAARADLKRYRKSILKAAVTGALTADWREERGEPSENGAALLARLLADRRSQSRKANYHEPAPPTDEFEIDIPSSWALASIEQLTSSARPVAYGVLQPGDDTPGGTKLVRVCDIADGRVLTADLKEIAPNIAAEFSRTFLQGGEVLLTLVGTIGRTAIVPESLAGANVARAVGVLVPLDGVSPYWMEFALREERSRQRLTSSSREVARKTLNVEQVRTFPVPLPPIQEQAEIVSRVEAALSRVAHAEATLNSQDRNARALKQSILKAAFEGQLVPQDPNDEPAGDMLARIGGKQ